MRLAGVRKKRRLWGTFCKADPGRKQVCSPLWLPRRPRRLGLTRRAPTPPPKLYRSCRHTGELPGGRPDGFQQSRAARAGSARVHGGHGCSGRQGKRVYVERASAKQKNKGFNGTVLYMAQNAPQVTPEAPQRADETLVLNAVYHILLKIAISTVKCKPA